MTCSQCRHEFCWLCLQDWRSHNENTGGFYNCNRWSLPQITLKLKIVILLTPSPHIYFSPPRIYLSFKFISHIQILWNHCQHHSLKFAMNSSIFVADTFLMDGNLKQQADELRFRTLNFNFITKCAFKSDLCTSPKNHVVTQIPCIRLLRWGHNQNTYCSKYASWENRWCSTPLEEPDYSFSRIHFQIQKHIALPVNDCSSIFGSCRVFSL